LVKVKMERIGAIGYDNQEQQERKRRGASGYLELFLPLYIERDQESFPSSIFFCNAFCP